jgi:triose/dihydroxyacetone kinase / FAD-AMP lyase (cyclizing)
MSRAHLFHNTTGLVPKALRGLISYNPSLSLSPKDQIVFRSDHARDRVALISGGGSGHEPAWAGYVGHNLLAAAAQGDIFASPSTKQILAAIDAVPSDKGTILVITNYTGDCLHFGLAAERASSSGRDVRMLICGDDVSVGRRGKLVGRRGLAGQLGVLKIMGGAAGRGDSIDDVYNLGQAVHDQIVSIATTLDHCHVPGRAEHATLAEDEIELGTGPHNEPGYKKLQPKPTAEELVGTILKYCLDETDAERGYVQFEKGDSTALMVSNFGGMSYLEMCALVDELLEQLERDWKIEPVRVVQGPIETSLNAPAFSVSIVNVTAASKKCAYSAEEIWSFWDQRTDTHWESMAGSQGKRRTRAEQIVELAEEPRRPVDEGRDLRVEPKLLEAALRTACDDLIAAEPKLTRWDTVLGDGDCGETLKTGATAMLEALQQKQIAARGSIGAVLQELEDIVEGKMGGTLGGILGLFFVSLRSTLEKGLGTGQRETVDRLWGGALSTSLQHLSRYTPAKVGDRTVMDTLIPFAATMKEGSFEQAVIAAEKGADGTRTLQPKLGRATYVAAGKDSSQDLPPDPGAWAAYVVVKGLQKGIESSSQSKV